MYEALQPLGKLLLVHHRVSSFPFLRERQVDSYKEILLGVQPLLVHGESVAAGLRHRSRLRAMSCAWAVNSRYAGALLVAGIPYAIWEPTTLQDELSSTSITGVRRAGLGTGIGTALHRWTMPLDAKLEGEIYRHSAILCTMSEYARDRVSEIHGIARNKIEVLLHPPSRAFLSMLARQRADCGELRPVQPNQRLLFVGRIDDPRKNFQLLRKAFDAVRLQRPDVTLTVVGPYTQKWRRSLGDLHNEGGTQFLGPVPLERLVQAYLEHDLLVLTSRQEGFGIVVAEAMHAGLPIIATRCGGPDAIIRRSGAGLSVEATANALSEAICSVLADEATHRRMKESALQFATAELSHERFTARVRDLTQRLMERTAG